MKILNLLEQDDNVIRGKFRTPSKAALDGLEQSIERAWAWPVDLLPLKIPDRKPGFWLSVFTASDINRVGFTGPFKSAEQAKQQMVPFLAQLNGFNEGDDEYEDLMYSFGDPDWYDDYEIRGPRQAGKLANASAVSEDECLVIVTNGFIPHAENVFLHSNYNAMIPVKDAVYKAQEEVAQTRYDIEEALRKGIDATMLERRLEAQLKKLKSMDV